MPSFNFNGASLIVIGIQHEDGTFSASTPQKHFLLMGWSFGWAIVWCLHVTIMFMSGSDIYSSIELDPNQHRDEDRKGPKIIQPKVLTKPNPTHIRKFILKNIDKKNWFYNSCNLLFSSFIFWSNKIYWSIGLANCRALPRRESFQKFSKD